MNTEGQAAAELPPSPTVMAAPPRNPYLVLGVVGFVLSFIAGLNIGGLIISIIALIKSKRLGLNNGFALAGIIIAGIGILFIALSLSLILPPVVDAAQTCARLGEGVHQVNGATYTCTPTSFHVSSGF